MRIVRVLVILLGFVFAKTGLAQLPREIELKVDSLKGIIHQSKSDSVKVNALVAWDNLIYAYDPNLDFELNQKIESICELALKKKITKRERQFFERAKIKALLVFGIIYKERGNYDTSIQLFKTTLKFSLNTGDFYNAANCYNNIGAVKEHQGLYDEAIDYYLKGLAIRKKYNYKEGIAASLNNVANIYMANGNYTKAIRFFTESLQLCEEINDKPGIATALNNIGIVYYNQTEYVKAETFLVKSLALRKKIGDVNGICQSLVNMGNNTCKLKRYAESIHYYTEAIPLQTQLGRLPDLGGTYLNLGIAYYEMSDSVAKAGDFIYVKKLNDLAKNNYFKSLDIYTEIGNKSGIGYCLCDLAIIYKKELDYTKSIHYGLKGYAIAEDMKEVNLMKEISKILSDDFREIGNYSEALRMKEIYIQLRDSIESEENHKEIVRQELKYKYEKQAAADSVKRIEEKKVIAAQLKQEKVQRMALYGGLGLTLIFGLFMFNRFRVTNKQKNLIEEQKLIVEKQKLLVEEKQKEILDSIRYAKRIQMALLPNEKYIHRSISKSKSNS